MKKCSVIWGDASLRSVPRKCSRHSIRLKGYDYSQTGAYFVTICTRNRVCLFGKIENGKMLLNAARRIAEKCWLDIPCHFPDIRLDAFVIMPNHIHGVIIIPDNANSNKTVGAKPLSPLYEFEKPMPKAKSDDKIEMQYRNLTNLLQKMGRVLVAFSGGVDSTFLLHAAVETLSRANVLAVTAISEILPQREKEAAIRIAREIGVEHLLVNSHEIKDPRFTANPPDKCYWCKKNRFKSLVDLAAFRGFHFVLDGENADDSKDYRPGSIAARELGVRSVLNEAGLTKARIRSLSKKFGLSTWNKPSGACLASRIPYDQPITPEKLEQIDRGENFLLKSNISGQVRVRHYGDIARIEVPPKDMTKLLKKEMRARVTDYFKSIGFLFVTLDLEGYSTGSLNRAVTDKEKGSPNGYRKP